jgi:tyrosyl-tRNA synthetase
MRQNVIEILENRGFIDNLTSPELKKIVEKPVKFYIGFDPTAQSLHLGNLMGIVAMRWLQMCGHKPYILVGGATGKIGDPSGKSQERPLLTRETLEHNVKSIKDQLALFLDFDHSSAGAVMVNNDDWFSKIYFTDFLRDVGKHFRIGSMLAKESVRARINSEEGMSYTEFSYQLLQAYDFYHLCQTEDVTLQLGGSDQWGNITAGIEFVRKVLQKSVYGLTFPLLTRSDGKKFGKSEGGAVWLSPHMFSPYKFYQYLYRIADEDVISLLKKLTFVDLEEIAAYEQGIADKTLSPNTAQKRLAEEVTLFVHGKQGLATALKVTAAALPGSTAVLDYDTLLEIKGDISSISLTKEDILGKKITEALVAAQLATSKGEASRLIKNGGAYLNNIKVTEIERNIDSQDLIGGVFLVLSSGKKNRVLIECLN